MFTNKRAIKRIALLAVAAMMLAMVPLQIFAADDTVVKRIYGSDRIATALEVAKEGWTQADTVILAAADQENLIDALAAAPLAGQENAPILVTYKNSLSADVKARITSLGAKKVYLVGALSDSVASEVAAMNGVTTEVLKGANRLETARAINAKLTSPAGTFVVGFNALPDALSVSSYAAAYGYAIIVADGGGNIPAGQNVLGSTIYQLGGPTLTKDVAGATRIYGADRYDTNAQVLTTLSFEYKYVYVANGSNNHLVDALVGGPLAAQAKAPIVLTDGSTVKGASAVTGKLTASSTVVGLGGPSVVSDSILNTVAGKSSGAPVAQDPNKTYGGGGGGGGGGSVNVPVTSVTLDKNELKLEVNKAGTLTATVEPSDASNRTVTWSSSDNAVATVTGSGLTGTVTALGAVGETATITVTSNSDTSKKATCEVTIVAGEEPPPEIDYWTDAAGGLPGIGRIFIYVRVPGADDANQHLYSVMYDDMALTWSTYAKAFRGTIAEQDEGYDYSQRITIVPPKEYVVDTANSWIDAAGGLAGIGKVFVYVKIVGVDSNADAASCKVTCDGAELTWSTYAKAYRGSAPAEVDLDDYLAKVAASPK